MHFCPSFGLDGLIVELTIYALLACSLILWVPSGMSTHGGEGRILELGSFENETEQISVDLMVRTDVSSSTRA